MLLRYSINPEEKPIKKKEYPQIEYQKLKDKKKDEALKNETIKKLPVVVNKSKTKCKTQTNEKFDLGKHTFFLIGK